MEKKKVNYFKEIVSGMDAFLAVFIGAIFCVSMFFVDHYNIINKLVTSTRWNGFVTYFYQGFILVSIAIVLLVCIPMLGKKIVLRRDFLLISLDSLSLCSLLLAILRGKHAPKEVIFWSVILGVGLVFTLIRILRVKEKGEEKFLTKIYFEGVAKKYNIDLLVISGAIVGLLLSLWMHNVGINKIIATVLPFWGGLANAQRIGILCAVLFIVVIAVIIGTLCGSKKSKVGWTDAFLIFLAFTTIFLGARAAYDYPKISTTYVAGWLIASVLVFALVVFKSLFTNPGKIEESKEKTSKNYYGSIFNKYSPFLIIMIAVFLTAGLVIVDHYGIRRIFNRSITAIIAVGTLLVYVLLLGLGIFRLFKGDLKSKKVCLIDWLLVIAQFNGLLVTLDLCLDYTVLKLVIWAILFVAVICVIQIRIRHLPAQERVVPVLYNSYVEVENNEYDYTSNPIPVEETKEEPKEEPVEPTPVVETVEEPETDDDKDDAEEVKTIVDTDGKVFVIRYKKSFRAKLSLSSDEVEDYYNEIKNYLLSYRLSSRLSWNFESFNKGRKKCVKLNIRGKTLVMYIALDPTAYENTKYSFRVIEGSKKYADVPMMMKIRSRRGVKYAKELIDDLMKLLGAVVKETPEQDYREEHRSFEKLLEMDLIREIKTSKNDFFTETPTVEEDDEVETPEDTELPLGEPVVEGDENKLVIKKRSYFNKLKFTSDNTKYYYNELKNALLLYGLKGRVTRRNEIFRKSGLVAKISISGKSLRLHLALDPHDEKFDVNRYHHFSLEDKRQYKDVPFTVKVKSNLGLKRALELIEICVTGLNLKKRAKPVRQDFLADLKIDGLAIFEKLGITNLMAGSVTTDCVDEFGKDGVPTVEEVLKFIPVQKRTPIVDENNVEVVYLDTVVNYIKENEVSLESLKDVNNIPLKTEKLIVKVHNALNRPLVVICDEIDDTAAIMVLKLGGRIVITK